MAQDKSVPPDWKNQIEGIIALQGTNNTLCADCGTSQETEWSVWNHGVFVCIKCAGIHRQIGVHISKVKSTQFDKWKNNELHFVKGIGGNINANKRIEFRKPKYFINPSECQYVDSVRKYFIRSKYESKMFESEQKEDAGSHEMPQKVVIGTFYQENNKKKAFLQLLGRTLYYFKNNHDSYDLTHHDVTNINAEISSSDSNNTDFVINIYQNNNKNQSIYRFRPMQQDDILYLIDWVHSIRRSKQYYTYLDNHNKNNGNGNDDEQKQVNNSHLNRKDLKPSEPLTEINEKDLSQGTILGIASKKGGGARSWRKRWWILLNGYLYYFKEDFRQNKKSKGVGTPQGNVSLYDADVIWDKDRTRTGKQNALMICTPKRTFYVQPQQQTKDTFFKAVDSCCDHLWDREPFDFVTLG